MFSVQDSDSDECSGSKSSSSSFPWWAGLIAGLGALCCALLVGAIIILGLWKRHIIAKKLLNKHVDPKTKQLRQFSVASHSRQSDSGVEMLGMTPAQRAAELSAAAEVLSGQ